MKKLFLMALLSAGFMLQADEAATSLDSVDMQSMLSKLEELKVSDKVSRQHRAIEDLKCDIVECQETINLQNLLQTEVQNLLKGLKHGDASAKTIKEFKNKNTKVVEGLFGKQDAVFFVKTLDLTMKQPYDVQSALVNAVVKSLSYSTHNQTKRLRDMQDKADKMMKDAESGMQVVF